jgi:hypothetical protein
MSECEWSNRGMIVRKAVWSMWKELGSVPIYLPQMPCRLDWYWNRFSAVRSQPVYVIYTKWVLRTWKKYKMRHKKCWVSGCVTSVAGSPLRWEYFYISPMLDNCARRKMEPVRSNTSTKPTLHTFLSQLRLIEETGSYQVSSCVMVKVSEM